MDNIFSNSQLRPVIMQSLMKLCPDALSAKNREEYLSIIYDKLDDDVFLKKKMLYFFINKNNLRMKEDDYLLDNNESHVVLTTFEVDAIKENNLLKDIREFELELFGFGEDYIEGNDDGIDVLNLTKVDSLFDVIVAHLLQIGMKPSEEESEIISVEKESFYTPLRTMYCGKPSTVFVGDTVSFFSSLLGEMAQEHLHKIMPCEIEAYFEIDEYDDEIIRRKFVFKNSHHDETMYHKMVLYMLDVINDLIREFLEDVPENFIHSEEYYKEDIDIYNQVFLFKDINATKKVDINRFYSSIKENFKEYDRDFFNPYIEKMYEITMDKLDEKLCYLEEEVKEKETLEKTGVSFFPDKSKTIPFHFTDMSFMEDEQEEFFVEDYDEYRNYNNMFD